MIRTGETVFINGEEHRKIKTAYLVKSLAYLPLYDDGQVIGVLGMDNRFSNRLFVDWQIQLLTLLADFASIALSNANRYQTTRLERDRLDGILAGTEDGVMVVDCQGNLLLCNPTVQRILHLPDGCTVRAAAVIEHTELLNLLTAETGRQVEISTDDERVYHAQMTIIEGVGRVIVMQDITHLKQLDRLKTHFIANISHDLRSPLTAIIGYAELLGCAGPLNAQQQLLLNESH